MTMARRLLQLSLAAAAVVLCGADGATDAEEMKVRLDEGLKWLVENGKREDVVRTDSGLQYRVIEKGDYTNQKPTANTECEIYYKVCSSRATPQRAALVPGCPTADVARPR